MQFDWLYTADLCLTRLVFLRALGFIYLMGFAVAYFQGTALIGQQGLLPARLFIQRVPFWRAPSLFYWSSRDSVLKGVAFVGLLLSLAVCSGLTEAGGESVHVITWLTLWVLYLSFVNIGQVFYGFGWETLLLETGFVAIFLGSPSSPVFLPFIWYYHWLLFRLMFGAGMIKVRGDSCWRNFTCMYYHYESQPLPNPLSWYFHHLPRWLHRLSVGVNHFAELILPFAYFIPSFRVAAALFTIWFQGMLIVSGNFSWLNCITLVICIPLLSDDFLRWLFSSVGNLELPPQSAQMPPLVWTSVLFLIFCYLIFRSYRPLTNMISKNQSMNRSYDPFHLVNTYGAFGTITRDRPEIILLGTTDTEITPQTRWLEYEFKGKPGDPLRRPRQVTPYHYKLDWQMWFAAMSDYRFHTWIINLIAKLLKSDKTTLGLLDADPFKGKRPRYIKADLYLYKYTAPGEKGWWKRVFLHSYLPPLSLDDPHFREYLVDEGWLDEKP